jgi:hypothetical protein
VVLACRFCTRDTSVPSRSLDLSRQFRLAEYLPRSAKWNWIGLTAALIESPKAPTREHCREWPRPKTRLVRPTQAPGNPFADEPARWGLNDDGGVAWIRSRVTLLRAPFWSGAPRTTQIPGRTRCNAFRLRSRHSSKELAFGSPSGTSLGISQSHSESSAMYENVTFPVRGSLKSSVAELSDTRADPHSHSCASDNSGHAIRVIGK